MTKLVINSDDFGYSQGINYGIVDCHRQGVLSSTTLMANMPGFEHSLSLIKENPRLGIGVHLSMTCSYPILANVTTLVQEDGSFNSLKQLKANPESVDLEQLFQEWQAQIERIKAAGVTITHLDTHHYTHSIGNNYQVIEELAMRYHLPIRNCFDVKVKLKKPEIAQ